MAMPNIQGMDTEYKPWGGLAGIMTGEREGLQHFANFQGMEEALLNNVLKQVEASRAANDFSNPEMERWRQAKLMGEGMQQDATGRLKQGTLNTDISAGNQKNQTDSIENQAKAWMTESDMIMSLPDGLAGATSGMQLSPQMQALAQQVGGIDRLKQVLPKINEMLKTQLMKSPKYMGDVALKGVEHGNTMERVRYEQGETNSRNEADNRIRLAEKTASQAAAEASTAEAQAMRKEQEITRRMNHYKDLLKVADSEVETITEQLGQVQMLDFPGRTKAEKTKERERIKKLLEDKKKEIQSNKTNLRGEIDRLGKMSSFGTKDNPIKLD